MEFGSRLALATMLCEEYCVLLAVLLLLVGVLGGGRRLLLGCRLGLGLLGGHCCML